MVRCTLCFGFLALLIAACSGSKSAKVADNSGSSGNGGTDQPTNIPDGDGGTIESGGPHVQYIGRVDSSDSAGPRVGWGGTRIVVRFQGTALSITIDDEEVSDGGSRYDVLIDGAASDTLALTEGSKAYDVATGLSDGTHVVTLIRRTEPQVGVSQFTNFDFHGGSLLAPPGQPTRHIEFVGDSEMAGYGVECTDPSQGFSADTENETKSYPELVATALNAEIHNLAFSGKGVLRNSFSDGPVYSTYYPQAVPYSAATNYDFGWKPDAIWVALGANDYDLGVGGAQRPAPDPGQFQAAYSSLFDLIRSKNAGVPIVLVLQAFPNDDYPAGYQSRTNLRTIIQAVVNAKTAAGDKNVSFAELPQAGDADLQGCDSHPTAAFHAQLAPIAQAKIAAVAGW